MYKPSPWTKDNEIQKEPITISLSADDLPPKGNAIVIFIVNRDDIKTGEEVGRAVSSAFEETIGHPIDLAVEDHGNYNVSYMFSESLRGRSVRR